MRDFLGFSRSEDYCHEANDDGEKDGDLKDVEPLTTTGRRNVHHDVLGFRGTGFDLVI